MIKNGRNISRRRRRRRRRRIAWHS